MNEAQSVIQNSLPDDVNEDSSLQDGVETDSSTVVSEEGTSQEPTHREPPFNEHPRFKELVEQRRLEKARADRLEQQLLEISTNLSKPKPSEQRDPYEGLTPEEKVFYENLDKRVDAKVNKAREEAERRADARIRAIEDNERRKTYKDLTTKYPNLSPGSEFELKVASLVQRGYDPFDACELITNREKVTRLESQAAASKKVQQTKKTTEKLAANLETPSVSALSPFAQQRMTTRQKMEAMADEFLAKA